jgi:hypothetical protein
LLVLKGQEGPPVDVEVEELATMMLRDPSKTEKVRAPGFRCSADQGRPSTLKC